MIHTQTVHINFTGGIISPGYLKEILEIAAQAKAAHVRFGLRQQLIIDVAAKNFTLFGKLCAAKNISFYTSKDYLPNIVSSYPAAGVFTSESWLREGVYKDIFDQFNYAPKVKINICDSSQSLIPFFTGHINWISSASQHFWYLYIRFPKTQKLYCCKELVYTNELALVSQKIEELILQAKTDIAINERTTGENLFEQVKAKLLFVHKAMDKELATPSFSLPYYEGFNKSDNDYWLGIYRRDELFPVPFLIDVCNVCLHSRIGQLYTTGWKSIIIKGIDSNHRKTWDYILGKYRINVRHAANELNWQVEDRNEDGLLIKRHIIRYFDKEDVRTYGLSFAVQTKPSSSLFGSIIIRKQEVKNPNRLKSLDRYDILYTPNFNPNSSQLKMFRENVEKDYLGTYLVSLCKLFYEQEDLAQEDLMIEHKAAVEVLTDTTTVKLIYQCRHCFTIYDDAVGDVDIARGVSFKKLPSSYKCPLCESNKEDFVEVDATALNLQSA